MSKVYNLLKSIAVAPMIYCGGTLYVNFESLDMIDINDPDVKNIMIIKAKDVNKYSKAIVPIKHFPLLRKIVYNPNDKSCISAYSIPRFCNVKRKIIHVFNLKEEWGIQKYQNTIVTNNSKEYAILRSEWGDLIPLMDNTLKCNVDSGKALMRFTGRMYFYVENSSVHIFKFTHAHENLDKEVYAFNEYLFNMVILLSAGLITDVYFSSDTFEFPPDYVKSIITCVNEQSSVNLMKINFHCNYTV